MRVIAQNGVSVDTHEIVTKGNCILGVPDTVGEPVELGTYPNKIRLLEVFADMACLGWNTVVSQSYEMPVT